MKRALAVVFLLAAGAAGYAGISAAIHSGLMPLPWTAGGHPAETGHRTRYQCAMHPEIVSDVPGLCPICEMRLEPVADLPPQGEPGTRAAAPGKILFYRHPMRADVTSPVPAKDEMGMDYIPVYEEDAADSGASDVPGHAAFALSPRRQQLIGVTRTRIGKRSLAAEIRAVGRVAYDPDLYRAIHEYNEAVTAKRGIERSPYAEAKRGADAIIHSAALRLRQLGLSDQQMKEIAETGKDPVNLLLPGKSVWVYAQVYEYEVDLVKAGQSVAITAPSAPGRVYDARIASVDPILNAATRTVRVRMLVSTPDASLRPETYVNAAIAVPLGDLLAVPEEAVFDTGEHQFVFVSGEAGRFEPRAVRLGRAAEGFYEVLSGLRDGEEVVTSANFLIDSESRFRAAAAAAARQREQTR